MRLTHDPQKLEANVAKHGVWFDLAKDFEWETALLVVDDRLRYGETRFSATGLIDVRLYVLVFTLRETSVRIISLRKANMKEVKRYASTN
jgi:uncharacterized DUF497 family protein